MKDRMKGWAKKHTRILKIIDMVIELSLIFYIVCHHFIGGMLMWPKVSAASSYGEAFTIANNMDTILLLQKEEWGKLNQEERVEVLQCICNIETSYLGLNKTIRILPLEMDEGINGSFSNTSNDLKISIKLLENDDPHEALGTVCHEMFHAAQFRYVEIYNSLDEDAKNLYFLDNASVYAEEFAAYRNGNDDDISGYYRQTCEKDARVYELEAVLDYYRRINDYPQGV